MTFYAEIIFSGASELRWRYTFDQGGQQKSTLLAQSIAVPGDMGRPELPPVWKNFYRREASVIARLDALQDYQGFVSAIVAGLEELASGGGPAGRAEFARQFGDDYLATPAGFNRLVADFTIYDETRDPPEKVSRAIDPEDRAAMLLVLYKAIYTFLKRASLDAALARLYAAWQWYNLAKSMSLSVRDDFLTVSAPAGKMDHPYSLFVREMAEAHHELVGMLEAPPEYDEALKWMAVWSGMDSDSVPQLREKMRLSLPLVVSTTAVSPGAIRKPLAAPGWPGPGQTGGRFRRMLDRLAPRKTNYPGRRFREPVRGVLEWLFGDVDLKPGWETARLHPVFEAGEGRETVGRQAIRQMISGWLLLRYDFTSAVQLARLLRKNELGKAGFKLEQFVFLLLFLIPAGFALLAPQLMRHPGIPFYGMVGVEWALIGVFFFRMYRRLDHSVLPYLILPRVAGGVLVGYFALILSEDSFRLLNFFFRDGKPWLSAGLILFLWLAVLVLGFQYLYYDALPFVGQRRAPAARARASQAVLLALALSAFIGLFVLAIASQMYLGDHIQACQLVLVGPLGSIDWQTYLIFVPIALFTGLVTQFIFEEKTVTTSVWSREVE